MFTVFQIATDKGNTYVSNPQLMVDGSAPCRESPDPYWNGRVVAKFRVFPKLGVEVPACIIKYCSNNRRYE